MTKPLFTAVLAMCASWMLGCAAPAPAQRAPALPSLAPTAAPLALELVFSPANARSLAALREVVARADLSSSAEAISLEFVSPRGTVLAQSTLEVDSGTTQAELSFTLPAAGLVDPAELTGTWAVRAVAGAARAEHSFKLEP